jgi:hypothetical protein
MLKRRHTFKRWAPDIGENRESDEPLFFLEVAVGLTAEQVAATLEALRAPIPALPELDESLSDEALMVALKQRTQQNKDAIRHRFATALGPYVRVHAGPHTIDGLHVATLDDYLALVQGCADFGSWALKELVAAFRSFNSFTGPDELFSLRRSGSSASTGSPSVVKDSAPKAGP